MLGEISKQSIREERFGGLFRPAIYTQALERLAEALRFGIDPSLENIQALCKILGSPEKKFRIIQIAGTNGKTSTSRMIAALCRAHGARTALYTSPELCEYRERMEIDGKPVSYEDFGTAILTVLSAADLHALRLTEFELLTAAALWLFAEHGVDIAVLEVGLGGRWDATSLRPADIAVITGISYDHTAILGHRLEDIAAEKAAIIQKGCLCALVGEGVVRHPQIERIFEARAALQGLSLQRASLDDGSCSLEEIQDGYGMQLKVTLEDQDVSLRFDGPRYQVQNIVLALHSFYRAYQCFCHDDYELCAFDAHRAEQALRFLRLPGRFEFLRKDPLALIDAAHNPESIESFVSSYRSYARFQTALQPSCVFAAFKDKDIDAMLTVLLREFKSFAFVQTQAARAARAQELYERARSLPEYQKAVHRLEIYDSTQAVVEAFVDRAFVACGSISLAGELSTFYRR